MRLGIMQPYFFPYLGHFSLIAAVDEWIVFDVTQYTPNLLKHSQNVLTGYFVADFLLYQRIALMNSCKFICRHLVNSWGILLLPGK